MSCEALLLDTLQTYLTILYESFCYMVVIVNMVIVRNFKQMLSSQNPKIVSSTEMDH
jgi:hypothetical protein